MRVGPGQDLFLRQRRQFHGVAHPPALREQAWQRRAPGKAPQPPVQADVDIPPHFSGCIDDRVPRDARPLSGAGMVGVGPGEDLLLHEVGQSVDVADAAVLGQQTGEGGAGRETPTPFAEGRVHPDPAIGPDRW